MKQWDREQTNRYGLLLVTCIVALVLALIIMGIISSQGPFFDQEWSLGMETI
ncbi:hypothetical protein [Butyrivibrio sp. TB]|uniref:hypothetical protein n=1 Tax=Butyrivibrio sp. TB TaxID=1520809 RepID=UPI0008B4BC42|nr:hypothetical protein [Butyrivibrio sp. TB]SEP66955.1 hypothetical protein SAMN02910382_00685 [Butyrivibrio sp. TB]